MNLLKPIRLVRAISNCNPRFSASQNRSEPQSLRASHIRAKTHSLSASQKEAKPQNLYAS